MFGKKLKGKCNANSLCPVHFLTSLTVFEAINQNGFLCCVISQLENRWTDID
jgi:hypothetical protein